MSQQMSYIHTPHTSPMESRMLFQLLDQHAALFPDKEAIVFRDEKFNRKFLTFKDFQEQSQYLAAMLSELGLVRGDQAMVFMPTNVPAFPVVLTALNRIGVNAVIMEPDEAIIKLQTRMAAVICTDECHDVISAFESAPLGEQNLKIAVVVGDAVLANARVHSYEALLEQGKHKTSILAQVEREVQPDDPLLILTTSGSTGRPKPIQYTNHGFVNAILTGAWVLKATAESIIFCDSPFDWITGLIVLAQVSALGTTMVTFPPRLSLTGHVTYTILKIVSEERVNQAVFLSYFMIDMLNCDGLSSLDLTRLQYISTGGQLTDRNLLKRVFRALPGVTVIIVYCATETFIMAGCVVAEDNVDLDDYGLIDVKPGVEMKVVDDNNHLVPAGTSGELYVRTSSMLLDVDTLKHEDFGYKHSTTPTGWHRTKDHAMITTNQRLQLLGRMDYLIKCATESIQPSEIESVLSQHENVVAVVAVGVPDQRLYELVCACVILKTCPHNNQEAATAELDKWCSDKFVENQVGLSSQPRHYVVFDKFPVTRTGKTDRRAIKRVAAERLGLSR